MKEARSRDSGQPTIKLMACGDINVQERDNPASAFERVREHLKGADVLVGNLEMCLSSSDHTLRVKRPLPDRPAWRQSDKRMVEGLVAVGFDLVTTANNVTYGADAVLESLETLDSHGIAHTGSGPNVDEARRLAIHETADGTTVGLLGYTCLVYPSGHAATESEPGVAVLKCHTAYQPHRRANELPGAAPTVRSWPDPDDMEKVLDDVAAARNRVDVLISYFHMGISSERELAEYQKLVSHEMVDNGVDLVLGASAHVPQAIEVYRNVPIFYGLGNFAFDWWFMDHLDLRHGLLVECEIANGRITDTLFRPVTRTRDSANQVEILDLVSDEGRRIVSTVEELSEEFGTTFDHRDDGAVGLNFNH